MTLLRATVHGEPALVIDESCRNFALGMEAGYIWSDRQYQGGRGSVKSPEKQHETEYHHLQDCWLYTLLRFGGAAMTVEQSQKLQARLAREQLAQAQRDIDPYDRRRPTSRVGRGGV
jgi:hypothetical protein